MGGTAHTEFVICDQSIEDPFGNTVTVAYDSDDTHLEKNYNLLIVETRDQLGNSVRAEHDYRVLQPTLLTDPNGNRAAVSFDVLGMVVGTAMRGKTTEKLGDCLASFGDGDCLVSFTADLTQQQINDFYGADDPHTLTDTLLGTATTRIIYDVERFLSTSKATLNDPSKWEPVFAATVAREIHVSDLGSGAQSKLQISFSYSDGFGREIQKKIQAEPGPVVDGGQIVNPRWVGSGWTIFNNKGKPVRQYEPFFSQLPVKGHQFEFGVQVGVSPILCYDPVERVVATIHPNHTYEKIVFDPWRQDSWDLNDTVLQADPKTDPDTGDFFQRLPATDYLPTWYTQRASGGLGAQEQDAATKAAAHANTPTIAYFDTLGRTFLTIADNAADGRYPTRVELDIEGNQRSVTDALGRKVMVYDYDMLSNRIHQSSMEAGERWMLNDVMGKAIRAWDSRGHNFRTAYDALRRPTGLFVLGSDSSKSDPRTLNGEVQYEKTDYGEGQPNDQALNLRTRVFKHYDSAGIVTSMGRNAVTNRDEAYDFKGNLLRSSRKFVEDYKALPDWSAALPALQQDIFTNSTRFDALNRPLDVTEPDGSVVRPTYNEANLLERVDINLRGAQAATPFVTNIDYNAKGQRVLIEYGNNAATSYTYDPVTFRMVHLTAMRKGFSSDSAVVQDLSYSYDPVGNITHIRDDADIHNVVFFRNRRVEPSNDYTYDAIYRLIQASGREHLGQSGAGQTLPPRSTSYNDFPRVGLLQPGDGNAMGTYSEQYQYDAVGNFVQFIHHGTDPANPGWTRAYTYNEASLLEPGQTSNRLTRTTLNPGGAQPQNEDYTHDLHGNIIRMPQLQVMEWDFKDQLKLAQRQAVNADDSDGMQHQGERTYYVYDAAGQRVRKVTERQNGTRMKERIYLGTFELYREYNGNGTNVTLERETLHVMDDKRRVALIETRTQGNDGSLAQLIRYQFSSHLGSSCLELDATAQVISYEEYYPYGSTSYQAVRSQTETPKRYRYTGKERDEENGLYYHGTRYYAPWLGRWTSADPTGLSDGPNRYVYTRANPIVNVDPIGTQTSRAENELFRDLLVSQQIHGDRPVGFAWHLAKNEEKFLPILAKFGYHGAAEWEGSKVPDLVASAQRDFNRAAQAWYRAGGSQYLNTAVIGIDASGNFYQGTPLKNAIEALHRSVERSLVVGDAIRGANLGLGAIGYALGGDIGAIVGNAIGGALASLGQALQLQSYFQSVSSQAHGPSTESSVQGAPPPGPKPPSGKSLPRQSDPTIAQQHMFDVQAEVLLAEVANRGPVGVAARLQSRTGPAELGNLMEAGLARSLAKTAPGLYVPIPKQGPGGRFISVADFLHIGGGKGRPFLDVFPLNPRQLRLHSNRWYGPQTDPVRYVPPPRP